ncbi:NAD(P)/FAD-dependent oxidoreductase [Methanofollis fontis]|uniref:FAD-binding domain-containing protein n=1 Tax=Methanofollis fontis TaxID=2052832 RepID=A0A483CZI3_9EURY|nr:hypothetical protein CUJ86_03585 [Methanofollis fontis]
MPFSKPYDAVIIGGGPAGASAGYLLARKGHRALIIDKKTFPRQKLCGGCLSDKTIRFLEKTYGETVQSLLEKNILRHSGRTIYNISEEQVSIAGKTETSIFFRKSTCI